MPREGHPGYGRGKPGTTTVSCVGIPHASTRAGKTDHRQRELAPHTIVTQADRPEQAPVRASTAFAGQAVCAMYVVCLCVCGMCVCVCVCVDVCVCVCVCGVCVCVCVCEGWVCVL